MQTSEELFLLKDWQLDISDGGNQHSGWVLGDGGRRMIVQRKSVSNQL